MIDDAYLRRAGSAKASAKGLAADNAPIEGVFNPLPTGGSWVDAQTWQGFEATICLLLQVAGHGLGGRPLSWRRPPKGEATCDRREGKD